MGKIKVKSLKPLEKEKFIEIEKKLKMLSKLSNVCKFSTVSDKFDCEKIMKKYYKRLKWNEI
jgi:hypothetical protein